MSLELDAGGQRLTDEGGVINGESWEHVVISAWNDRNVLNLVSGDGEEIVKGKHDRSWNEGVERQRD